MTKQLARASFGWGFLLWLFGYVLGIALFAVIPASMLGWAVMPFGLLATVWVLLKRIRLDTFRQYALLAVSWTLIAIVCDYVFLVKLFHPADGYYKLDVYAYYALTFILPVAAGIRSARLPKSTIIRP